KLNIMGAFDRINGTQSPIVSPMCAIAIRIRTERFEEGTKKIQILFIDADGKTVLPPINSEIQIQLAPGESTASLSFVLTTPQLKLSNFGEYAIDLRVDGVSLAAIPLYVRQLEPPAQSQH